VEESLADVKRKKQKLLTDPSGPRYLYARDPNMDHHSLKNLIYEFSVERGRKETEERSVSKVSKLPTYTT
jgi:hypothetical protein